MKKIAILLIGLCVVYSANVDAQCKIQTKIKKAYMRVAVSEDCKVEIEYATKPRAIFSKYGVGATYSFIKSGEEYYLFYNQYRGYSSRYEILENNSIVLIFEEGEPLSLYPCGNFSGKMRGLTTYNIACYYKITREELQIIADNKVEMVLIHISSDQEISNTQVDEDGTVFFEYVIRSDNYAENAPTSAACILSK